MATQISYLADHPEHLETITKWYWDEWDRHEGWDIERSRAFAKAGCNKDKLDIVLIALNEDQECVGTIQLRKEWGIGSEIPEHLKQYSPWLGSLYVRGDYRGGRIGFDLCEALEKAAKKIGIKKCYVATAHLDKFFKLKNGVVVDETHFANEDMRVYEFSIG